MAPADVTIVRAARLHGCAPTTLWDIHLKDGKIDDIVGNEGSSASEPPSSFNAGGRLLLPSLCHAHIHLDKCFTLHDSRFDDLKVEKGDFEEAMKTTAAAKARFDTDDIIARGRRLIRESLAAGVTMMRAHVEVDEIVSLRGVDAAIALQTEFASQCHVQICVFAQLALFSAGVPAEQRRSDLLDALNLDAVEALGTTPYVEDDRTHAEENIRWAIQQAVDHQKHLDFHLDYNIDPQNKPLIWYALDKLKTMWPSEPSRTICFGHCTRINLFPAEEMRLLETEVNQNNLPVTLIGLPTSDMYMMGRPAAMASITSDRPRGTLQIPHITKAYNLNCALGINNVGNAFTPYSTCDPLQLSSLGMLVYQAATVYDCEMLYQCVSTFSKKAVGAGFTSLKLHVGSPADFILFGDTEEDSRRLPNSASDVVYSSEPSRVTFYRGRLVSESRMNTCFY